MSVRLRLFALALLAIGAMGLVGLLGLSGMRLSTEGMKLVVDLHLPAVQGVANLNKQRLAIELAQYQLLTDGFIPEPERVKHTRQLTQQLWQNLEQSKTRYLALARGEKTRAQWAKIEPLWQQWQQRSQQLDQLLAVPEVTASVLDQYRAGLAEMAPLMQQLERELETLLEMTNRIANENEAALVDTLQQNSQAILWFGLLATAGFILLAQWIIRTILRPLNAMRTTAENSSQDLDLTRRCQIKGQDEIARTAQAFNHLLDTISHSFAVIVKEGDSVNRVAEEVATASQQIASATEVQSESSASIAASVEEMLTSIAQIAGNANQALQASESAQQLASSSDKVIVQAAQEIQNMVQAIQSSAEDVSHLAARTDEISRIVQTIAAVAEQTNLLALNASIEAARAGEQGRGFAVVADEVRQLAEKTRIATTDISQTIAWVQEQTRRAADNLLQGEKLVSFGVSLISGLVKPLSELRDGAVVARRELNALTEALQTQSATSRHIGSHVESLAAVSEQNSAAATQSASAAQSLNDSVGALRQQLARFRLPETV